MKKKKEMKEKKNSIIKISNVKEGFEEDQQSSEWIETQKSLGTTKTSKEQKTTPLDKFIEPTPSSKLATSASMNMINESVGQLNSIRKDLYEDYNGQTMAYGQAKITGANIEKIKTMCMVSREIVNAMKLGLELIKVRK